jgi:3',5'-cyclic AMP phosphodiesterase CpdA
MRVAILADIHGNLPACEAVLQDIARTGADVVVAAGDLALRGAHPRETVELLADRCQSLLMGNTDCYIAGNYLGGAYREREHWKRDLLSWTRDQLGPEWTRKLGELPFSIRFSPRRGHDLYVCHANPRNLEESVESDARRRGAAAVLRPPRCRGLRIRTPPLPVPSALRADAPGRRGLGRHPA